MPAIVLLLLLVPFFMIWHFYGSLASKHGWFGLTYIFLGWIVGFGSLTGMVYMLYENMIVIRFLPDEVVAPVVAVLCTVWIYFLLKRRWEKESRAVDGEASRNR